MRASALCVALAGCRDSGAHTTAVPDYVLVTHDRARSFATAEGAAQADLLVDSQPLGRGFGFALSDVRDVKGTRVVRTRSGRWVAMNDVAPAHASAFTGVPVDARTPLDSVAFVTQPTPARDAPSARGKTLATLPRLATLRMRGPCRAGFCPSHAGWVTDTALRRPTRAPRPPEISPHERWIDIDEATQTLIAFAGDEPLYTTLVSTGTGRPGSALATPHGVFRIHTKRRRGRMDNLEHTGVVPYAYDDIPHVQIFTDRVALHVALWHDRFGSKASHGCVNVSPADGAWLFAFTKPALDDGATEITADKGTAVRVR